MTVPRASLDSVRARFSELRLHDSRLLSVSTSSDLEAREESLILTLSILSGDHADEWTPGRLVFTQCSGVEIQLDFWAKRACRDTIVETSCEYDRNAASASLDDNPVRERHDPISSLLLFTIDLCPPGGRIRVFARDFVFSVGQC